MDETERERDVGGAGAASGPGEAQEGALAVRRGPKGRAQKARMRQNSWTPTRRALFITTLAQTCNISEAARAAGMSWQSAYKLKERDAGFARAWLAALAIGYDELEAVLLREALFGHEDEEVVLDAEGAVKARKVRRGRDHGAALRQLIAHRGTAEKLRGEMVREARDGEDSKARLAKLLEEVRVRAGGAEPAKAQGAARKRATKKASPC